MRRNVIAGTLAVAMATAAALSGAPTATAAAGASAPRQIAYAVSSGSSLSATDVATNTSTTVRGFSRTGPQTAYTHQLAVSPDGRRVYALGNNDASGSVTIDYVSVIDTATNEVIDKIALGSSLSDILVSPDGKRLYVSDAQDSQIWVVDATTDTVITAITAPATIYAMGRAMALSPEGGHLYAMSRVLQSTDTAVVDIDTVALAVHSTVAVSKIGLSIGVSPDGRSVYVTTSNSASYDLAVIDASLDQQVALVPSDLVLRWLVVGRDGLVYAAAPGTTALPSQVKVYSPTAAAFVSTITLPSSPSGITLSADGKVLYVQLGGTWYPYDLATGAAAGAPYSTITGISLLLATVAVFAAPTAHLAVTTSPQSGYVIADASSSTHGLGIVSYQFDFGDGTGSSGPGGVVGHTYYAVGTYHVAVTITDAVGATSSATLSVFVEPLFARAALLAKNGLYVTAGSPVSGAIVNRPGGAVLPGAAVTLASRPLAASSASPDLFDVVEVNGLEVALRRVSDGHYVRVDPAQHNELIADVTDLASATVLRIIGRENNAYEFQVKATGLLVMRHDGAEVLTADGPSDGFGEPFVLSS
jgi:YVTN family beta-propeller protein